MNGHLAEQAEEGEIKVAGRRTSLAISILELVAS